MTRIITIILALLLALPVGAAQYSSTQWTHEPEADCTLAAGVFTVAFTGHALVRMPSVTAGTNVDINLRGYSYTFNDATHGSDHLTDMGFGVTETVDWAEDVPWFIYLVNEDDTAANVGAFIAKDPTLGVTPAAGSIHDKTAAAAGDTQNSIFGMWADDAGKAAKPCILIGAIRMQWDTTNDSWTVQTLGNNDGVGKDRLAKTFGASYVMPFAQMGARAGTFLIDNGGTAPLFTDNAFNYNLGADGTVQARVRLVGDPGDDGAGAVTAHMSIPYASVETFDSQSLPTYVNEATNGTYYANLKVSAAAGGAYVSWLDSTGNVIQNGSFANGNRSIIATILYRAF